MTTTTKTKRGRFTPWCWEAERDEYNGESLRGWHLSKRTLRNMTYEYAPEKQYRYAIDYRMEHNEARYLELFEADGWELVGTVVDGFKASEPGYSLFLSKQDGCWYIFRKEYYPWVDDSEYEIATDEESIRTFKKTLTKKYRNRLLYELFGLLIYLPLCLVLKQRVGDFFLLILFFAMLHAGYRLLCLNVLRPRKTIRLYLDYSTVRIVLAMVIGIAAIVGIAVQNRAEEAANTVPVTADNTPVQMFLELRPDITVDEVISLAEEYNLEASESYGQRYNESGELIFNNYTIELLPYSDLEYDRGNSLMFYRGVAMALSYNPDTMELESAYLSMDTDDGRAYCHYFPGEPTVADCETGYNLFLRKAALAPRKYYHAETPEEIIAIAYPVLYPDGLE